ncbi:MULTISPECIES: GNAT family N-acetyltransferase [Sporosarcina]|uniref:GNAT family N-acetyltransferase n=1 Tax=Sporosarcina contaminans TaxID=633403 RepID=A0ABW3TW40_9BACL
MDRIDIRELITEEQLKEGYNVMRQLRSHLDEVAYLQLVNEAKRIENYRQFALYANDKIAAVIGFQPMVTLYYGKFIWICDFVTDELKRSKGYGEQLLTYIHDLLLSEGYETVALSSGLQRESAHSFYKDKMKYEQVSYVFKKTL